jgi:phenylalanyl-tRNA synthetase beta chain
LAALTRNRGRGNRDLALFEMGLVYLPKSDSLAAPDPGVAERPSDAEIAELYDAVPDQPRHLGAVLAGDVERPGWWGDGRTASWADAIDAARIVARTARADLVVRAGDYPPCIRAVRRARSSATPSLVMPASCTPGW